MIFFNLIYSYNFTLEKLFFCVGLYFGSLTSAIHFDQTDSHSSFLKLVYIILNLWDKMEFKLKHLHIKK